jgi:hypothetical protein
LNSLDPEERSVGFEGVGINCTRDARPTRAVDETPDHLASHRVEANQAASMGDHLVSADHLLCGGLGPAGAACDPSAASRANQ